MNPFYDKATHSNLEMLIKLLIVVVFDIFLFIDNKN